MISDYETLVEYYDENDAFFFDEEEEEKQDINSIQTGTSSTIDCDDLSSLYSECTMISSSHSSDWIEDYNDSNPNLFSTIEQDLDIIESSIKNKSYLIKKPKHVKKKKEKETVITTVAPWIDVKEKTYQMEFHEENKKEEYNPKDEDEDEYDLTRLLKREDREQNKKVHHSLLRNRNIKVSNDIVSPTIKRTQSNHSNMSSRGCESPSSNNDIDLTRLCKFGKRCTSKSTCQRAHSFEQWQPSRCHYDNNCKIIKNCRFIHSHEDKKTFLFRIIHQEDNRFYYANREMYLKNFNLNSSTSSKK